MRMKDLIFPDGIIKIGWYWRSDRKVPNELNELEYGLFRNTVISGEVRFPDSLKYIGEHTLFGAEIGRLTLPKALRGISCGAFMHANIKEVVIPYDFPSNYEIFGYREIDVDGILERGGRQFKESRIEKLYLPEDFDDNICAICFREANIREIVRY